jgi:threonine dehydratase
MPASADLRRAHAFVASFLGPTPLIQTAAAPNAWLKLECLQPTGSFKVRGALAALSALTEAERRAGVIAASAGNHALGVAFAAKALGVSATVVVPTSASAAKIAALQRFDVKVVRHGDGFSEAEQHALELISASGMTYVSPYNDPLVIAGQASVAAEIEQQLSGATTIVVPIGGGGLASGVSLWARNHPDVNVIGVEADSSLAVSTAVRAGRIAEVEIQSTVADGLAGNIEPNSITPAIIAEHTSSLLSVSEAEIVAAIRFLASDHGLVVEGAGAVSVAALLAGKVNVPGNLVALVTGRNIALALYAELLSGRS